ncbi:MAG: BadF/BadG/BcrA/BcrD ATPase family protein [Candidatus Bipolaricaulis sp.]|nr:BadF/BadG/BcrA/BcrD ATPase family protein [Candidatus Bipolaricaulis sp.]
MILGVDGGGTKTLAVVVDSAGRVVGTGRSGPSNYQVLGLDAAVRSLRSAVRAALSSVPQAERLSHAVFGLAGADFALDRSRLERALATMDELAGVPLAVRNDAEVALVGAVAGVRGVAVCAGTGAIAVGMDGLERVARADGWGYLLGDEGSGYWIGLEALRAVVRRHDGRARRGRALEQAVLGSLNVQDAPALLDWTYGRRASVNDIAALAPLVLAVAAQGDPEAARIVHQAGTQLSAATCAVVRKLGFSGEAFPLVALGGLFRSPQAAALEVPLRDGVRKAAPRGTWQIPLLPAEFGAVLLGAILDGRAPDEFADTLCCARAKSGPGPSGRA